MNQGLYGKEEAVRLALLSAVANESIFFMGPPGTAKSMISRRIACAFKDFHDKKQKAVYFEYLMNEFSTPDEICGPVDLSALNEKPSRYVRQTGGYLPTASVAFLDEIWKSGPAILNTLLTIINEKKFHNGKKVESVPLVSLAAASNELPEKDRGLEALWDRFVLRVFVNPVANENDFFRVVDDAGSEPKLSEEQEASLLGIDEVKGWQAAINAVELSDEAKNVITAIRQELTKLNADGKHTGDETYYVSDRRWKKIVHILKTSAFLNGRNAVDLMDCSLIEYAIWNTDKQHDEVSSHYKTYDNVDYGLLAVILRQNGISATAALDDISDKIDRFRKEIDYDWFDAVTEPATDKIVVVNGEKCYECTDPEDNSIWYVGLKQNDYRAYYSGDFRNVYDRSKQLIREDCQFSRKGDEITCWKTFKVNKNPAKTHLEPKKGLSSTVMAAAQELFDKKKYNPIKTMIDSEKKKLFDFKAEQEKPFCGNSFADTYKYCPVVFGKIDTLLNQLESKDVDLDEQRHRYHSIQPNG